MKINYKLLALCIAIPLAVGSLSGLITKDSMEAFETLNKPALSPPGIVFPIVWTILYTLMGISSYLVVTSGQGKNKIREALIFYGLQLIFNFFWSIWFFSFGWYLFSFIWLLILWVLIFNTIASFYEIFNRHKVTLIFYAAFFFCDLYVFKNCVYFDFVFFAKLHILLNK